jgi:hypothetical protein
MSNTEPRNNLLRYIRSFFSREEPEEDQPQTEENKDEDNDNEVNLNDPRQRILGALNNLTETQRQRIFGSTLAVDEDSDESDNGRRYYYMDDEAESHDELINPVEDEEYIDFRTYPLNIDWNEIENEKTDAYKFYDKFGYFGITIYQRFKDVISFSSSRFEFQLIEKYSNLKTREEKLAFVKKLPDLGKVRELLYKNMRLKKELVLMKIYFDILENYYLNYDFPYFKVILSLCLVF